MRCCDCSGNCESTTTIPFFDNRNAMVPPFSVKTPTSLRSIFIFQGSSNIVLKIFCCAKVNAPKLSADERRKFRRFINNNLKSSKGSTCSKGFEGTLRTLLLERQQLLKSLEHFNIRIY